VNVLTCVLLCLLAGIAYSAGHTDPHVSRVSSVGVQLAGCRLLHPHPP
jgi:hypothetical protein